MVIMKNIFKDTVVSYLRGQRHCITTLTKLSAGNIVVPQDIEQWTSKERHDFNSNLSTWALCYDHVDRVNVYIDPRHLEARVGNDLSASYRGNAFQTMECMLIYHDSQVARNHLEKLKGFPIIYSVKSIKELNQSWRATS
jgi:hypothetical protein